MTKITINPRLAQAKYAVRGELPNRAMELEKQGKKIHWLNIGNPIAVGQKYFEYNRKRLAKFILEGVTDASSNIPVNLGSYTESQGLKFIRKAVAEFISERDEMTSNEDDIFLSDGASKAIENVLQVMVSDENDSLLTPIPQYPLYSATIQILGGHIQGYFLDEQNNWAISPEELERSYNESIALGKKPLAVIVINPNNPTGSVLSEANILEIIKFAKAKGLVILADEVYQNNVYDEIKRFHSFAKVAEKNNIIVPIASFHSASKGLFGECGFRGGYVEIRNFDEEFSAQLIKKFSIGLCANSIGQVTVYNLVKPPIETDEDFEIYNETKNSIFNDLKLKSELLYNEINTIPFLSMVRPSGAMYAFVKVDSAIIKSDQSAIEAEREFCLNLLEKTGICVVPGNGFLQKEGEMHFRMTILPRMEELVEVIEKLRGFCEGFCQP